MESIKSYVWKYYYWDSWHQDSYHSCFSCGCNCDSKDYQSGSGFSYAGDHSSNYNMCEYHKATKNGITNEQVLKILRDNAISNNEEFEKKYSQDFYMKNKYNYQPTLIKTEIDSVKVYLE